jgi:metallophosphoesterase (TIGR03767 family)
MDTRERIVQRGEPDQGGWCEIVEGPGESTIDVPGESVTPLACLVHLTDLHICDAESPARIEYLDRLGDPDSPLREEIGHVGSYRPQEILTMQVADAMVRTVNEIERGPITGAPVDAVLLTGDVTDNAQANELSWYRGLLDGGSVAARSGDDARSSWVGVSDADSWDERYWHPDGPPAGIAPDRPTEVEGFPRCPGLIDAARADFDTPGLRHRWVSVHGNHDGLLQGTLPADEVARSFAVGASRVTGLPEGGDPSVAISMNAMVGPVEFSLDPASPTREIPADERRRIVEPGEHADVLGMPGTYGVREIGALRLIYLDTVNPHGGWQGSLDSDQFRWLKEQLRESPDTYTVIASHHPSPTMINDYAPDGAPRRVLGSEVVAELLEHDQVIAWIAGHVHFHAAIAHHRPDNEPPHLWEITTSALIDWPQQGRVVEFLASGDRIGIACTVIDHDAPIDWRSALTCGWTPETMAALSRVLAANDYQLRADPDFRALRDSNPQVRNRVWWLADRLGENQDLT